MDIVEEENEEFYIEILEYVDKHHHVIPIMDILDRTTIYKNLKLSLFEESLLSKFLG